MNIVIIGNGVAGTNAARFIRKKSNHKITMISEESWSPFSRTALMYIYMGHLKKENTYLYEEEFWNKNRIDRILGKVIKLHIPDQNLILEDGKIISYDTLIIASGSKSNKLDWPGQDLIGVQGLYTLQDLEGMERQSKKLQRAVIVGGGLIGIEMAEMFHSRHIPVSFLVREKSFWDNILPTEESAMVNRHILEHGIDLRLETELKEIQDNGNGEVKSITTIKNEEIDCEFVGLTAGVSPNISFLEGSGIEMDQGVLVDQNLRTSVANIYAIGDCAEIRKPEKGRRPIEAIWYTGRMMGQTVAATICGEPTVYQPKLWFNSAKFFDIEYQVYGDIPTRNPEDIQSVYWEHAKGKKSIRINYNVLTKVVTGFNLMGIRYRHEVCEKWILDKTPMETVLQNLSIANFEPEFYTSYENALVGLYNRLSGSSIQLKSKRNVNAVFQFLHSK